MVCRGGGGRIGGVVVRVGCGRVCRMGRSGWVVEWVGVVVG